MDPQHNAFLISLQNLVSLLRTLGSGNYRRRDARTFVLSSRQTLCAKDLVFYQVVELDFVFPAVFFFFGSGHSLLRYTPEKSPMI